MAKEDERLLAGLHPLERKVLPHLKKEGTLAELAAAAGLQEVEAMRALQWLESKGVLRLETREEPILLIKEKGKRAHTEELPEHHIIVALKKKGELAVADIAKLLPAYDKEAVGPVVGKLKRLGIPFITTKEGKPAFKWVAALAIPEPAAKALLARAAKSGWRLTLQKENDPAVEDLLQRQGYAELQRRKGKLYLLSAKGSALATSKATTKRYEERLTPAMLQDGSWKQKAFRPYNVTINVPAKRGGRAHFVNEAIQHIKRIWLDMGFEEMEGDHVQTAFWDLDALFVPQDHPAREMQDTFYLQEPARGMLPPDVFTKVKAVHENGGDTGSLGWRAPFSKAESERLLLRTHTTVLSAQNLDRIRRGEQRLPAKFFSVNKVYRNEALDWKHLFEFHQVEGIVVAEGMTLGHLKGFLREFFGKMGFPDVRIRPAHFPYTEPSCEVDVWDARKNQWVELGGAGIFRPEVTKTLIGKEVPVLAWGLGMERIIKEYYGLEDVRDLYRNDLEQSKTMRMWLQ